MAVLCLAATACVGTWPQPPRQYASSPPPPPAPAPAPAPPCELPAPGPDPLDLSGCSVGETILLRGLEFEVDSHALAYGDRELLDIAADALHARPDIRVEVQGHTDNTASAEYNLALSERRANTVMNYLVARGIPSARISMRGFGLTMPVADNETEEGRARNRRVEMKVLDMDPAAAGLQSAVDPSAPGALGNEIIMNEYAFEPDVITVVPGTTVIWHNQGAQNHVLRFPDGESYRIPPGESRRKRFDRTGEFSYDCGTHPTMTGTVIVKHP